MPPLVCYLLRLPINPGDRQGAHLNKPLGIAATGHAETSRVAAEILAAGGNAFDAAVGALCAACVAEPLLVSLGGGGFLLAHSSGGTARVYDFFCHTPARKRPVAAMDFFPIDANFGNDTQEFHVGMGAIAVPGTVAGLFRIQRDLGRMPMAEIMQPAIELARTGVRIDALQHYIVRILEAILRADDAVFSLFESPSQKGELIAAGELLRNPAMAQALEQLGQSGEDLFYRGDWAAQLAGDSRDRGGNLSLADLANYRVETRDPLRFSYRGAECLINPPPSPGGCLIAFAIGLLQSCLPTPRCWGDAEHVCALVQALRTAALAREENGQNAAGLERLLDSGSLARWRGKVQWHSLFSRGTTHISVADAQGNLASLTASNGEGNTYVLPGTGIILNNMLGEEDLNPGGFHRWREDSRLVSMMSPLIVREADGSLLALGSGGSNRIRSAIMQVLVNIVDFGLPLRAAVESPRLHLEGQKLSIEAGYGEQILQLLRKNIADVHAWPSLNLFFGGVHTVRVRADGAFEGAGDPRRDGAVAIARSGPGLLK
jgi:gamma-glutamyltranspeptidase/glutathione hydrolase